eukprot:4417408-Pyramimonas_sp.AAC.2
MVTVATVAIVVIVIVVTRRSPSGSAPPVAAGAELLGGDRHAPRPSHGRHRRVCFGVQQVLRGGA